MCLECTQVKHGLLVKMFARIVTIVCPCPCFTKKDTQSVLLEEVVVEDTLCAYDLKEVVIEQTKEAVNDVADMV